jgi:hypothetical protein
MIAWTEFDWPSFATLAAGAMAVVAATIVGVRQARIAARQTEILDRQGRLAEVALRNELFEKRYVVFERTRDFVMHIIHHAEVADGETRNDFLRALGEAAFLFRPQVHQKLDEIWRVAGDYAVLKAEMNSTFAREGHYGDGNPQRNHDLFLRFPAFAKELPDVFDELKLGEHLLGDRKN